jgi:o-succinylbenzoate---CoA ligase
MERFDTVFRKRVKTLSMEVMPNFLKKRAFLTPSRTALVFENRRYTFQQVYVECVEAAGRLHANGIKKGQYVALLLSNHSDTVVLLLALQLLGVKAVMLNTRLTAEELQYQLEDSNSACLITESHFKDKAEKLSISIIYKLELYESPFIEPPLVDEVSLDEVCSLMYTSGTTGSPKGVMQTYGNHWWSAVGSSLNLGLQESDGWLCAVPLFHISGYSILMRSVIYGMKMVLHESFNVEKTIEDIQIEKITTMSVVSTMLTRLLDHLNGPLPSHFRCMLLGGGPASLSLLEKCIPLQVPVYQTYGMTETASQFVTLSPEYSLSKLGSAGKALFPSQLKIIDSDGLEQQPLQSGEILVKGPNVTKGYLNKEGSHLKDGWFATGDIGFVDDEGFLYVQDRRSDLIISGGENIYPAEIEGVLQGHPAIQEAGVIGVDDQVWGQVPVAFVVNNTSTTEEEIIQYCSSKLAKYKVPKKVIFARELPRNASNKLLRRSLKEWIKGGEQDED